MNSDRPRDTGDGDGDKENKRPGDKRSAKDQHVLKDKAKGEAPIGQETPLASLQRKLHDMENSLAERTAKQTKELMENGILPSNGRNIPDVRVEVAHGFSTGDRARDTSRIQDAVEGLQHNIDSNGIDGAAHVQQLIGTINHPDVLTTLGRLHLNLITYRTNQNQRYDTGTERCIRELIEYTNEGSPVSSDDKNHIHEFLSEICKLYD